VNEDFIIENTLLWGLISRTVGNPEFKLNWSCNYWWSPAWLHIKLTGLSLKLFTV